jgi:hypothetical protein
MDDDAQRRRLARASWPVRRIALADEGESATIEASPSALVAMVHRLTMDAWATSGRALPDYERRAAPGRVIRRAP